MERYTSRPVLDDLGTRICIMGPSNSGKSTLASAVGRACALPVVHLDQLYHVPNSDWQPRAAEEFLALHDQAIRSSAWIMEGNYSLCLPQRLKHATGFILLDVPGTTSLYRYIWRSWFQRSRHGALEGGRDSVKWDIIRHIAITTRRNRRQYSAIFEQVGLPKVRLLTTREIVNFYRCEGLHR
ncbi:AAA family ATPase [Beijerinckia sp. L45]|uniref:AAA family ATPase n=1 Tax=Beijerinckia sp. L45 TaxID=1641855 RepID=UPI00131AD17B|nr:AAA family ATPase [Beijerinckia sp. L45]